MKNKKGQAVLEFLLTYGWSLLVVLIAILALWYYGVFEDEPKPEIVEETPCHKSSWSDVFENVEIIGHYTYGVVREEKDDEKQVCNYINKTTMICEPKYKDIYNYDTDIVWEDCDYYCRIELGKPIETYLENKRMWVFEYDSYRNVCTIHHIYLKE